MEVTIKILGVINSSYQFIGKLEFVGLILIAVLTVSCHSKSIQTEAPVTDTVLAASSYQQEDKTNIDILHKYSYVKKYDDGTVIAGMIDIYTSQSFTQAVTLNGLTKSGRGRYTIDGDRINFINTGGVSISGYAQINKMDDGKLMIILDNGVCYIEDDLSYYIKNMTTTPSINNIEYNDTSNESVYKDINYYGTVMDEQSGISQNYTLQIKPDFYTASIANGPYNRIEDQGDGSYMWVEGSMVGMSFRPYEDKCVVYGSDGNYFCTLYRQ